MHRTHFAAPALFGMLLFMLLNCLTGFGVGLLATESTAVAVITGVAFPALSIGALGLLWLGFRRRRHA